MEQGNDITNTQVNATATTSGQDNMTTGGVNEGKKGGKGMLYGMILCAILAIGGIGFGVWAMMDGNSQVAKKDEQISELREQLAEKSETVEENTTVEDVETGDDNAGTNVKTADYIYVGEWGVKIKKPIANLVDGKTQDGSIAAVDYAFDGARLYIWGTVYRQGDQAVMGDHLYVSNNGTAPPYLIKMERVINGDCLEGEKIGELDGYSFCYVENDDKVLAEVFGDDVVEKYVKPTMIILKDVFSNIDSYQQI